MIHFNDIAFIAYPVLDIVRARQFYEEHFDWEMSTRKLEQFYNQVLHRKLEANAAHYLSAVKIAASAPSGSLRVAK